MFPTRQLSDILKNKRKGGEKLQALTVAIRIFPAAELEALLLAEAKEYTEVINYLTIQAYVLDSFPKLTTAHVEAKLPSAVLNQAIRDAKSIFAKYRKTGILPEVKKPCYYVNNQNYSIKDGKIGFPLFVNGKAHKVWLPIDLREREQQLLSGSKPGLVRVIKKRGKWFAQIAIQKQVEKVAASGKALGVDLGLKVLAVASTTERKTRFFGYGCKAKCIRRKYRAKRRKLGKLKKLKAIRKLNNKEQRVMTDLNHKISRRVVDFAKQEQSGIIRLKKLTGIRETTCARKSTKNEIHSWSFYQLQRFISYKAALAGIRIEEIDPKHTSQYCPQCGEKNKANDRRYICKHCGYTDHRDRIGSLNIAKCEPLADGVA